MNRDLVRRIMAGDGTGELPGEGGPWKQVYGRNSPRGIEMVYEGADGPAQARSVWIPAEGGKPDIRIWHADPALPALALVRARHPGATPVRYRPGKRCTLRKGSLFLKCLADGRGAAIDRDARLLRQAEADGQLAFGVARPAGWLPSLRMIVQHRVPGEPVAERLWSPDGAALARQLGAANASLCRAKIPVQVRFTYADQLKRTAKYARRLAAWVPGSEPLVLQIQERLAEFEPGRADRPIHGAPHAHQWLDGPAGPMLVDFDRFSLGDPELDAATFAAEAEFEASPHARATGLAFIAGFDAEWQLDQRLLLAYRAHKHVAKALRTAVAIRPDASARALEILVGAKRLLECRR